MYDSLELLSKDLNGGGKRNRESWSQPQDTWTSVAMLCQVWSHLRVLALPAWHKEMSHGKTTGCFDGLYCSIPRGH